MKSSFIENETNKNLYVLKNKCKNLIEENTNLLEKNYKLETENKKLLEKNKKLISFLNDYGFNEELMCFEKNIDIKNIKYFQKDSEEFFKKEIKLLQKINELEKTIKFLKQENNIINNNQENNSIINHIYNVQPNNSIKKHRRLNSHLSNESFKSKDFQNNNQKINNFIHEYKRNNNNNNNINFYYNLEREESNKMNKSADEKNEDDDNFNIFDKKNENYIIQFEKNKEKNKFASKCFCKKCNKYFIKNEKSNQINYGCYFNFNDMNNNLCPNCNKKYNNNNK